MSVPNETPELLFHTTLTVIEHHADTAGSTRSVYVLGTHATLPAAKRFAASALQKELGYDPDDFDVYEVHPHSTEAENGTTGKPQWTHGDGVVVYAKAPAGHEFLVGLDTKPNTEGLPASADDSGTLRLPDGCDNLHYVIQTKTDYNQDTLPAGSASPAYHSSEIEGCYAHRASAIDAARVCLLDSDGDRTREDFAQYDERDIADMAGEWPFGEDTWVHAVAHTGENYTVAVRTAFGAHKRHGKKHH